MKTLVLVLLFYVLGQALSTLFPLPVPATVLGMLALLAWLLLGADEEAVQAHEAEAAPFLKHLGLFFIPASVGIITHLQRFVQEGLPLAVSLVASVLVCLIVTALGLRLLAR